MLFDFVRFQTKNQELISQIHLAEQYARKRNPIVIYGERGTGRRLMAEFIHDKSLTPMKEMKRLNSTTLSQFEVGQGDTVILESIDQMTFMEQQLVSGLILANKNKQILWIATAQSDLAMRSQKGFFHKQLADFFVTASIRMPNLNERSCDIPDLVQQHSEMLCLLMSRSPVSWSPRCLEKFQKAKWKGNFTEFERSIEMALQATTQNMIEPEHVILPSEAQVLNLAEMEKKLIAQALELTQNNKTQAARLLGISIRTLRNKLNEYRGEAYESDLR